MYVPVSPVAFASVKELDLTSTFVRKAANIARRKLEQKSKTEQKAKKSPVKEKSGTTPEKVKEEPTVTAWKITFEDWRKNPTACSVITTFSFWSEFCWSKQPQIWQQREKKHRVSKWVFANGWLICCSITTMNNDWWIMFVCFLTLNRAGESVCKCWRL